jgi:CDP-glucose 4,6-dehydratase
MKNLFNGVYAGKNVFVTGHTGFKGSWLAYWLTRMGAQVTGFSRKPPTDPNHFDCLKPDMKSVIGDINDAASLTKAMLDIGPQIVFHLAAQPLVRQSYAAPVETYLTNVVGTLHVCEACRTAGTVKAIVAITTDKVYENREWEWPYRENDRLGGHDPYSSSKACAEILLASYRNSFLNLARYGKTHTTLLSSVRAGNVVGGGDWGADRLIPDIMKSCAAKKTVVIRNPQSTRPWQHVLDCLSGYLLVGQRLLEGKWETATSFNFGPALEPALSVEDVILRVKKYWPAVEYRIEQAEDQPHEANCLMLDCSKARAMLSWRPVWGTGSAFRNTVEWYREYYEKGTIATADDLEEYVEDAKKGGAVWTR